MMAVGFFGTTIFGIIAAIIALRGNRGNQKEETINSTPANNAAASITPPIPQQATPGQKPFVNTDDDSIGTQLKRAGSLLQLNIVSADELGSLSTNIASGKYILSQGVYHDVVNLHSMMERKTIDGFMYEMQRTKMLELKYLPQ